MHRLSTLLLAAGCAVLLGACAPSHPKSLSEVAVQLSEQFRNQHDSKPQTPRRNLKSVSITSFGFPTGNFHPYLGVAVDWSDGTTYTSLPMVQLGDGLFAVTYQDATTKEELSAIVSFR